MEFVEIQTVGHLLVLWLCGRNWDIVMESSNSKKNAYMKFQAVSIFYISYTEVKLCQVIYIFFINNIPVYESSK